MREHLPALALTIVSFAIIVYVRYGLEVEFLTVIDAWVARITGVAG